MTTLAGGTRLGPYEILAPIGAGGMGEVYRAHDGKLARDVAIKVLPPTLAADPAALARFEREAKAVAALSHPHILAIHDFGRDGSTVYAVMELLEGHTLRERLTDGALPVRKVVEIALQIAQGLAAAHEKGIVHRDLKPDNVFVTANGRVKILDFGLAKAIQTSPGTSETVAVTREASTPGMVVGTVGYMAPEQVTGAAVDHRTDIFAFGAVVYEMSTGRRAFARGSSARTVCCSSCTARKVPTRSRRFAGKRVRTSCGCRASTWSFRSTHRPVTSCSAASASPTASGPCEPRQLVIINRAGQVESAIGDPQPGLANFVMAPDGRRVAARAGASPRNDVWIYDLQRTVRRRLTFLGNDVTPSAWTADNRVIFTHVIPGRLRGVISAQSAEGTGAPERLTDGCCGSLSKTGSLIFMQVNDARESDIDLHYRAPGETTPKVFLERAGSQENPTLSTDGAYVAYQSNESGRYEVYVRPFPSGGGQWQVSLSGGSDPRWSERGDKLWFRAYGNVLMEVDVKASGGTFAYGEPRELFTADPIAVDLTLGYAVLPGGERFVAARRAADPDGSVPNITVVQNWFAEFANKR